MINESTVGDVHEIREKKMKKNLHQNTTVMIE